MFLFHINYSEKVMVKKFPNKSCIKDNFHPSRYAALLYTPLDGHHGKAMLIFTFAITKYSTPSQVVPTVMPFPKLSLRPL